MTKVGSGQYCAPEIRDNNKIYVEYDLKIDVFSLGTTFCSLAFFDVEIPDDFGYKYSKELIGIIQSMIDQDSSNRPSAQEAYNNLIKFYFEKYINSTGIISCIKSLFTSPSIQNYFCNNNLSQEKISQLPITEKLFEIFKELYFPQQNINMNNIPPYQMTKKSLNHLIFELKELLVKNGMNINERSHNENCPINIITFMLKKLHDELNIYRGELGKLNRIFGKTKKTENPKKESYENYKEFYTKNFFSIISNDFFGLIKTKTLCLDCENAKNLTPLSTKYSFKVLCYFPINVKIFFDMSQNNNNNNNLSIYDAFDCLNYNFIELDKKKYIQCDKCGVATAHKELKQLYNLSKNIVIIFDRGENYIHNNYIDFPETLTLNCNYVENIKNIDINYKLYSIICRMGNEQNNNNKRNQEKYESFRRNNNGTYSGENMNQFILLNKLKIRD